MLRRSIIGLILPILVAGTATSASGRTHQTKSSPAAGGVSDWRQDHFDAAHSGFNPYEHLLSAANVSLLEARWTTNRPIRVQGTIVVSNETVFVGGNDPTQGSLGRVFALDARSGTQLWQASQPNAGSVTGMAACCGLLFVSTIFDGKLHAYDARTGQLRWEFPSGGGVSGATVVGHRLLIQTNTYDVFALDAQSGGVLWQRHLVGATAGTAPTYAAGSVYVAADKDLYAIRMKTGHLRWKTTLPGVAFSSPTVAEGRIFEASSEDGVYALSALDGHILWQQLTGFGAETAPTIYGSSVLVGDVDGNLFSFDQATGQSGWVTRLGGRFVQNDASAANDVVYAATTGVFGIDAATGAILWSAPTDTVNTPPVIVDGVLYVGDFAGDITAFGLP